MRSFNYTTMSLIVVSLLVSACADYKSSGSKTKPKATPIGTSGTKTSEPILSSLDLTAMPLEAFEKLNLPKDEKETAQAVVKISRDLNIQVLISADLFSRDKNGRLQTTLTKKGLSFIRDDLAGEKNKEALKETLKKKSIAAIVLSSKKTRFTYSPQGKKLWHIDIKNNDHSLNATALIKRLGNLSGSTLNLESINQAELKRMALSATYKITFELDHSLDESRIVAAVHIPADPSSSEAEDALEMNSIRIINDLYKTKELAEAGANSAFPAGIFDKTFKETNYKLIVLSNKCLKISATAIEIPASNSLEEIQACLAGKELKKARAKTEDSSASQAQEEENL